MLREVSNPIVKSYSAADFLAPAAAGDAAVAGSPPRIQDGNRRRCPTAVDAAGGGAGGGASRALLRLRLIGRG
jgi:hypothetical protein